ISCCLQTVYGSTFTVVFYDFSVLFIFSLLFFFNATAPTEIYTLSLHDALPISRSVPIWRRWCSCRSPHGCRRIPSGSTSRRSCRSEEHTSELQSLRHLVCRLLLEKKKKKHKKQSNKQSTQYNPASTRRQIIDHI